MNDQSTARRKRHLFFSVGGVAAITAIISAIAIIRIHAAKPIAVTNIKTESMISLQVGASVKIPAEIKPGNATDKSLLWQCADTHIATVDSKGDVMGKSAGTTVLRAINKSSDKRSYCIIVVGSKNPDSNAEIFYRRSREGIFSNEINSEASEEN